MDEEPSLKRRLAAILAADVAGYSRLMGDGRDDRIQERHRPRVPGKSPHERLVSE
jgi:class 3 adenylate cyclase